MSESVVDLAADLHHATWHWRSLANKIVNALHECRDAGLPDLEALCEMFEPLQREFLATDARAMRIMTEAAEDATLDPRLRSEMRAALYPIRPASISKTVGRG